LSVSVDGNAPTTKVLGLEATERIIVPLSATGETKLDLSAERSFPLAAPDTRSRSFRIVNIDFD
jgi:hypothetical protein